MTGTDLLFASAYGGPGWCPRVTSFRQELGSIWGRCGVSDEWSVLQDVLLHRPGDELRVADPDQAQMMTSLSLDLAQRQHDALSDVLQELGVSVHYVRPRDRVPPNLMFVADLLFMTPEGAIVGRPASVVRAGEEKFVARRLAELGIPILRCVRGRGTFEGADAAWLDSHTVLLATGLRTNAEGAEQVASLLREMDVTVIEVGLPHGAMHLMGQLRFADRDLALAWPGRVPYAAVDTLQARGFQVLFAPDESEAARGMALNFVTLAPRSILMAAGNPITQSYFESAGISCLTAEVGELTKAAGGIGCLTGVLRRDGK